MISFNPIIAKFIDFGWPFWLEILGQKKQE